MTEFLGTASATTKVILGIKGVTIDNLTFQLHYKVTTAILMIGAALTTSKQFLGDPIACEVVNKHHGPIQIFNGLNAFHIILNDLNLEYNYFYFFSLEGV